MGYTHHWEQIKPAEPEQWKNLCEDFRKLLAVNLITANIPVAKDWDTSEGPEVNKGFIIFNGVGDDGFETFVLEKNCLTGYEFCKTAHYPYDTLVTATLILADHHCPHVWSISSDGNADEWEPGLQLARKVCPSVKLPHNIRAT